MSKRQHRGETAQRAAWRLIEVVAVLALAALVIGTLSVVGATSAQATIATDAQSGAQIAEAAGYRTGIAVLDLKTGAYYGAGEDTASFASESVVKVMIAAQLLLSGQMTGSTETTAYQMITQSDDADADALYGLAGADNVINLIAAHYNIPSLGTAPSSPGWWGNTEINAKAMVYLYAAITKDPVVGPWLTNAMANATEYGADGTYQFFGIPSATTGAAIKQGWGDDGDDSPNAVFNSTGYVDGGTYAVAILADGPPSSYGTAISNMVTSEAKALMPGGKLDDPADHNPVLAHLSASSTGSTVHITGTATDPDTTGPLVVQAARAAEAGQGGQGGQPPVASGTTAADTTFDLSFLAVNGTHTYTVTVINVGEGTANANATTAAITVDGSPHGGIESVTGGPGIITVTGQETNPNLSPDQDPKVTVVVSGQDPITEPVDDPTPQPAAPAATTNATTESLTGYTLVVPAPAGHDDVTVIYLGTDGGPSTPQGTWPVTVAETAAEHRAGQLRIAIAALAALLLITGAGLTVALRRKARRGRVKRSGASSVGDSL